MAYACVQHLRYRNSSSLSSVQVAPHQWTSPCRRIDHLAHNSLRVVLRPLD